MLCSAYVCYRRQFECKWDGRKKKQNKINEFQTIDDPSKYTNNNVRH